MNDIFYQLLDILGAAVGQFPLCQRPNAFIGVELRSVGRKMLNAETRVSGEELLERFTLMSGGVIQEDDDGAAQVPQQRTQKRTDFLLTDILKKKEIVEAQSVPLGADRNAGYHRDFVPPSLAMPRMGVSPCGAQVRTTVGIKRKPDSSAKTMWAPSRAAFFLPAANPFSSSARFWIPS